MLSLMHGKPVDEIKRDLVNEVFKNHAELNKAKYSEIAKEPVVEGKMADFEVRGDYPIFHRFSQAKLFPAVLSVAQRLIQDQAPQISQAPQMEQKVIVDTEIDTYLAQGWLYKGTVNHTHVIVERPRQDGNRA